MIEYFLFGALCLFLISLIIYGIVNYQSPYDSAEARTGCLQTIIRAVATGFMVPYENMSVEQKYTDAHYYWVSIIFDHWLILIYINWNLHNCKIVCTYNADSSGRMLIKTKHFNVRHNVINEAALIKFIKRTSDAGYIFSAPTIKDKAVNNLTDAVSLAKFEDLTDKDMFDLMFEAWSHLPFKTRQEAEDFVKITAFLMRHHTNQMKDAIEDCKNHR